jgi:protein ImuB
MQDRRRVPWEQALQKQQLQQQELRKQRRKVAALRTVVGPQAREHARQHVESPVDSPELWVGVHAETGLQQLAIRAQRFTPRVNLAPPDGLLLEVKGSLHLFDGVAGLLHALAKECASSGVDNSPTLAPTPLAALVAARAGEPFVVTNQAQLVGRLAPLPLAPLRWPEEVLERLARMGVWTIGQVLRLPRAGFARRFGVAQLAELDRLTGRSADPRPSWQARERFRRRRELTYELESNTTVLAALAPMLAQLGQFLQARQSGVTSIECLLRHRHAAPTSCRLRLAAPMADIAHLTNLLAERLSLLVLPEPVRSCELRSGPLVPRVLASHGLWRPGEHGSGGSAESPQLIERLRARLGTEAVYSLQVVPAHRPENAWRMKEPDGIASGERVRSPWAPGRRPLWLLSDPQPLEERGGLPLRGGPLRLSDGLERIETGWWDGRDIARDYYEACDTHGVRLWIFRERASPHRWFLHGVFR